MFEITEVNLKSKTFSTAHMIRNMTPYWYVSVNKGFYTSKQPA